MSEWWEPPLQTTVDAYYAGELKTGLQACEQLLSRDDLPWQIELQVRRNLVFYTPKLQELTPLVTRQRITIPVPEGWSTFNPSIAADPTAPESGFALTIRSANYTVTRFLEYDVVDDDGVFRTANYLASLSPDLQIQTVQPIDDTAFRPELPPFPVSGYEDARLVKHCGSWWFSATVRDHNPRGTCQIALLRLEGGKAVEEHLLSDGLSRDEKNWMPVAIDDPRLRFVYSLAPTVVLRYDDAQGIVVPEVIRPGPAIARTFSGSSQVIAVDGGYLCLIHDRVNFEDGSRIYHHRWVWFDAEWRLARLSPPFSIQHSGIEFAAGLARHGEILVFTYGVGDREAWLGTVPLSDVLALLAPPIEQGVAGDELAAPEDVGEFAANPPLPLPATPPAVMLTNHGITPFPATSPFLVSTTLAGNNQGIVGDAIRSVVDWVDRVLVIDTGIGDETLEIARSIAGDKLLVRQFPWRNDFAAARNFALAAAAETGAYWAVTLDTDERIDVGDVDVHAVLAATTANSLHVKHVNATYGKERFFRLPARGHYVGPTHEAFIREGDYSQTLEGVMFDELGKTHEQYRQKAERDIAILTRHTQEHPDDPRWFYYLADSYAGLGQNEEAIAAFRTCASLNGWDEEGGWAMYRAAECLLKLNRPAEAVEACAAGMAKHAGQAELPWLAAFASWQAGRPAQAVYWARQAIAMGHFAGHGASVPRIGFRHPPALWEGPYDVLRFALRAIGDEAGADEAERLFHEAKAAREGEPNRSITASIAPNASDHRVHQHELQASMSWETVLAAPAFVINLDRNPERLAASRQALEAGGFRHIERFPAIDGSNPAALASGWAEIGAPRFEPADREFQASLGRQGLFLSHVMIWRRIVAEDIPIVSIFEDDPILHKDWESLASLYYAATPKDFDLLLMGSRIVDPIDEFVQQRPTFNLNAYLMTNTGAAKLLDLLLHDPAGISSIDVMVNNLQVRSLDHADQHEIVWYAWNGARFPDPKAAEAGWFSDRNMGLVFQDWTLGSETDGWKVT